MSFFILWSIIFLKVRIMKIVLQDLTKRFKSRDKNNPNDVIAVNHFNFEIPDGKLIGLLGPSGCGKSTALNLISGLLEPTEGKIIFGEDDVTNLPAEKRGVGLVFQNYALYPHMTVRQNILFPLENLKGKDKLTKQQMNEKVLEVAKLVQIENLLDRKPSQMSGGQQQRVAIARALVKMPKVLLMDEPLSNLDARLRLQTREEIKNIQNKTKITTIFVTHDQDEAMSISDLIVIMKDGVIHQIDQPQKVYDDPKNLFVAKFLGTPPINVLNGKVVNEQLWIGDMNIMDVKGVQDQDVYVGIRPEAFVLDENGPLKLNLKAVETMGRDTSVISLHEESLNPTIRSIISAENNVDTTKSIVSFSLKPYKTYIFNKDTEERILFE